MAFTEPCLKRDVSPARELVVRVGVPLLDDYLEFLAGRARPNTVLAAGYDVVVFFRFVAKEPREVTSADVLAFITSQRSGGDGRSLRAVCDSAGVSARTVRRRLSTISGLFFYLTARGDVVANPVPGGLPTRREVSRPRQTVPLVRSPRTLPRVLEPAEVDALLAAARTHRDRAMFQAMVLGGLRRCEVLGLRMEEALDDADAAKFLRAAQGQRRLLIRVVSEVLLRTGLRTGLRVGELIALRADAIVLIGDGHWCPSASSMTTATCPCTPSWSPSSASTAPRTSPRPTHCCYRGRTAARWTVTPSPGCSTSPRKPPGSATSTPTRCATPWPPRPSTGA